MLQYCLQGEHRIENSPARSYSDRAIELAKNRRRTAQERSKHSGLTRDALHNGTDPINLPEGFIGPGYTGRKVCASSGRFSRGVTTNISGGAEDNIRADPFAGIMVQTSMTTDVGRNSRRGSADDTAMFVAPTTTPARPPPAYEVV